MRAVGGRESNHLAHHRNFNEARLLSYVACPIHGPGKFMSHAYKKLAGTTHSFNREATLLSKHFFSTPLLSPTVIESTLLPSPSLTRYNTHRHFQTMTAANPRVHPDLDFREYVGRDPLERNLYWDMRYDPRERNNIYRVPRFPYHFQRYGPRTTAFIPRMDTLCVLFRYYPDVPYYWTFNIVHRGPVHPQDGNAVNCEDVITTIYEQLQLLPSSEEVQFSTEHNRLAEQARLERCTLLGLDSRREPVRRIDYVKGVLGGCAFAGLDGYSRHLDTPMMRIYTLKVTPRSF